MILFYDAKRPPAALRALQRDVSGPFDAEVAAAGQQVILARRAGAGPATAAAWRRLLRSRRPRRPAPARVRRGLDRPRRAGSLLPMAPMAGPLPPLRLALAQIDCHVGDLEGNAARISRAIERARDGGAELVLAPELAVTGYPPEDLLLKEHFLRDAREALERSPAASRGSSPWSASPSAPRTSSTRSR